jgi:hypothetical protein
MLDLAAGSGSTSYSQADELADELIAKTQEHQNKAAESIRQAIDTLDDWRGSEIIVKPHYWSRGWKNHSDDPFTPVDDSNVTVSLPSQRREHDDYDPSFTWFSGEFGHDNVDDVLQAGDDDFFYSSDVEADYFMLVNTLKRGLKAEEKVITTYTARPRPDRKLYQDVSEIPGNVFLTTDIERAVGYAEEYPPRDVWMVRVSTKYLTETYRGLTNRGLKFSDYQVTRPGQLIPVESIVYISSPESPFQS